MNDPSGSVSEDDAPGKGLHAAPADDRTLRQFQIGWVFVFGSLAVYHACVQRHPMLAAGLGGAAVGGAVVGWLAPAVFRRVYLVSMLLTRPLGWVVSQAALVLMFFAVLTPLALAFRVFRRDRLRLTKPRHVSSFWRDRNGPPDLRRYFRSY